MVNCMLLGLVCLKQSIIVVLMGFPTLPPVQHMPKEIVHIGCFPMAVLISDSAYAKLGSEACLH